MGQGARMQKHVIYPKSGFHVLTQLPKNTRRRMMLERFDVGKSKMLHINRLSSVYECYDELRLECCF